ncbi:MAG TPA: TonB family protein [Terriglobales bacterium]|nr:TonB family protein [Terriglobales bacterium]
MFTPLRSGIPRRQAACLSTSLALHFLVLGFILQSPKATFLAPSQRSRGEGGSAPTRIYFGGQHGILLEHPAHLLFSTRSPRPRSVQPRPSPPAKIEAGNDTKAALASSAVSEGSPFGSLFNGQSSGFEVRPALPTVSVDPEFEPDLLAGRSGDVVVEITIDVEGNIVDMKVLESLGPIDQRVLAALAKWHFLPATRNGAPVASKQDVHYHFPR